MHYGNGFIFSDVYELPVYLRRFYFNQLLDAKKEERKQVEKQQNKQKSNTTRPNISNR